MTKELVISTTRHETRVAVLEDDQLVEIYFQRSNEYSLAGSIHKGRVTRVLPGMQSAFVDLGLERDTFLYVSDFFEENDEIEKFPDDTRPTGRQDRYERRQQPARVEPEEPVETEAAPEPFSEPEAEPEIAAAPEIPVEPAEPAESAAHPPAAATAPRPERDDRDRDRGGRRSRRRRGRGRGFPDSKYASPDEEEARPETAPVQEAAAAAEPEPVTAMEFEDVLILPGESLAKYRRGHAPAPPSRRPQSEPAQEETSEPLPVPEPAPEAAAEADPIALTAESEPAYIDAPAPEAPIATSAADISTPEEILPDEPEAIMAAAEDGPAAAEEDISEPGELESELGEIQVLSEEEDLEIQEMILEAQGDADIRDSEEYSGTDEVEGEATEAPETAEAGEGAESGEAAEAAESDSGPTLASVRDQGGRAMHRMSRRMRRRMRGDKSEAPAESRHERPREERPREDRPREDRPREDAPRGEHRSAQRPEKDRTPTPSITELLKEGQEIIVQIAKEPLGQKGARITSHIALPGRYVVYMPTLDHMGVSRKIASDDERLRLKKILQRHRVGIAGGFIVRTAGEGRTEDEIAADMTFLGNLWLDIRAKAEKRKAPALLHHDLDIVQRILRDQLNDAFKSIWVDTEEMYERILRFVQRFQPALVSKVKMYTRPAPIFDAFNITNELEKALRPKVWLKSGGYIVINQTEALVAVDINTGKFVGKSNRLEDTIVKTNTDAVKEIVRQIRLRDLGGIIVIDFIDMDERKNRQKVMQALEEAMRSDRAPYKILQFNDFGLVAITRKRVKQSLERTLCSPCPHCEGAGYVKSVTTVIGEMLVEAQKIAKAVEGSEVVLRCHPDVAKTLKSTSNRFLEEIEETLKRPVLVVSDPAVHHEKFDLA